MQNESNYIQYLSSIHSRQTTQDEIIRDVIKEANGQDMLSKRRIIAGEVNEVYDVTLNDQSRVILRISPNGSSSFQQEEFVLKQCQKAEIPVPEILFIKYLTIDHKEYGFCVMQRIDGGVLDREDNDFLPDASVGVSLP